MHGIELVGRLICHNIRNGPSKLLTTIVELFNTLFKENSENIWKLNRYDLILEYWGKSPLSCTPFLLLEHFILIFKLCIFHGKVYHNY